MEPLVELVYGTYHYLQADLLSVKQARYVQGNQNPPVQAHYLAVSDALAQRWRFVATLHWVVRNTSPTARRAAFSCPC
jgi:hypothetical protein